MNRVFLQTAFKNDEDRRLANILSILIGVTGAAYLVVFLSALFWKDAILAGAALSSVLFLAVPFWLLRRGRLLASGNILVLLLLGTVTFMATIGQGIHDISIMAFPGIIIFASLSLNRTGFKVYCALSLAALVWLVFGEESGLFVSQGIERPTWIDFLIMATIFLITALGIDLLVVNMRRHLELARQEIAQRKQAEAALLASEARYRRLVENAPDIVYTFSNKRGGIYYSPRVEQILGYPADYLYEHPMLWNESIHPDDHSMVDETVRGFEIGKLFDIEYRIQDAQGNWRWLRDRSIGRDAGSGEVLIEGLATDMTERKQIEEALRTKTKELDRYFGTSLDLFCIADTGGFFRRLNPQWEKTLGYSLDELHGSHFLDFVHPEDLALTQAAIAKLSAQETVSNFENRYRCKDGSYRWIEWRSVPAGKLIYAAARDITERRLAQDELSRQTNLLGTVIESSSDAIFVKDANGKYITMNEAGARILGRRASEVIGRTDFELLSPEAAREFHISDEESMASGQMREREEMVEINGKTSVFLTHKTPWRDSSGNVIGVIGVSNDITEQKKAQENLRYQGTHDGLTDIYNRAFFEAQLARLEKSREFPISIIIADVDKLKILNDTLGHATGDELLRDVAKVFASVFRESDVLARIGGDEFAVLLPATNAAVSDKMLARVRQRISTHNSEHPDLPIQISLGSAVAETGGLAYAFRLADLRMYAEKATHHANITSGLTA